MQSEQSREKDYLQRISRMKDRLIAQPREICMERARLFTESYKKSREEDPVLRFAKAMDNLLTSMTIHIDEDEFIVGNRTSKPVGTPLFPEVRVDVIEQDVDTFDTRLVQKLLVSEEEKRALKKDIIPYWKNEEDTVFNRFISYLTPELKESMNSLVFIVDTEMTNGVGHFFPGHENLLERGIEGLLQEAEQKAQDASGETGEIAEKRAFWQSVAISCRAAGKFIKRFADLAREMASDATNQGRQEELLEIAGMCDNIAGKPPASFKEALQLVYFNHLICGLEDGGFAISIGRLDQYLYPYYAADRKNRKITASEASFLIECFFIKLSTLWNYLPSKGILAGEGPPIAQNLTIGGLDHAGHDATNELSYMMLNSYTRLKTVQPTFSIRIHDKTPERFMEAVYNAIISGASVALFNDQVILKGLQARGYSIEDAREYAPVGCVEPQHPHKSFGSTNANQINVVKCLKSAMSHATIVIAEAGSESPNKAGSLSYDDVWKGFIDQMSETIKQMVSIMNALDRAIAELTPKPFLSSTIDDCMDRGLDVTRGGALYDFTGPQLIGLATTADSLAVLKKVVFEDKILGLDDMVEMLKKNYRGTYLGKKGNEWREFFINRVPKYGNNDDYVDNIAVDVARAYCDEISKYTNFRGGKFNPGIYSTSFHLAFGLLTGATPDGRKAGDPLSNGIGPTSGMDKNGPTSILNSVSRLDHSLITNGNTLTLAFSPSTCKKGVLIPLVRTFFTSKGGFHVQFNVVGKETLLDAQKNPDNYHGLVLRIAGYSVLFTELSKAAQDDIIARTEY